MKHNPNNLLMANLKEEGLAIVDKRGIAFEDAAQRDMIWEGRMLIDGFREQLGDYEQITDAQYAAAMRQFKQDIGAN